MPNVIEMSAEWFTSPKVRCPRCRMEWELIQDTIGSAFTCLCGAKVYVCEVDVTTTSDWEC